MRKSSATLIAGASVLMLTTPSHAQTRGGVELGGEVVDYNYREQVEGERVARDDARFAGLSLGYVETFGGGLFIRGRLSVAKGSVDYRADASGGVKSRLNNVSQGIGQLDLQVGRDFTLGGTTTLTPFLGFGSRVLVDRSGGKVTDDGLSGYDREIDYAYVPVGVAVRAAFGNGHALTVSAQYDWVIAGQAKSKFSEQDPELPDVTADLNGGNGFELSAIADVPAGGHAVRFGPFLRRWSIKQSESVVLTNPDDPTERIEFFEPKNRTTELGLRLSFAF